LTILAKVMQEVFIPEFEKKQQGDPTARKDIGLAGIAKSVIWLTESELRVEKIPYKFSYAGIEHAVSDKSHVVHDAYRLRMHPTKDKEVRRAFIEKLKKHLKVVLNKYSKAE